MTYGNFYMNICILVVITLDFFVKLKLNDLHSTKSIELDYDYCFFSIRNRNQGINYRMDVGRGTLIYISAT